MRSARASVSMLLVFAHNLRQQVRAGRDRAQFAARDMRGRFITAASARPPAGNATSAVVFTAALDGGAARADYFTSTSMRIQGWMQHSKRCLPFERPVISRWLP